MVLCIINIPAVIFNVYMTSKGNNQTFQYLRNILRESQFPIFSGGACLHISLGLKHTNG